MPKALVSNHESGWTIVITRVMNLLRDQFNAVVLFFFCPIALILLGVFYWIDFAGLRALVGALIVLVSLLWIASAAAIAAHIVNSVTRP